MKNKIKYFHYNWGPYLFRSSISDEFRDLIIQEGARIRQDQSAESMNYKLAGHLTEQYILPAAPFMEQIAPFLEAYCTGFNKWRGAGNMKPDGRLLKLWINFMKAGDFNPPHDHSGDLSFIIYPEMPEKLIKENESYQGTVAGPGAVAWMSEGATNRMDITGVNLLPQAKDIFIFPATLKHWVFPFKSNITRCSVSGNILFAGHDSRINYPGTDETQHVKDENE